MSVSKKIFISFLSFSGACMAVPIAFAAAKASFLLESQPFSETAVFAGLSFETENKILILFSNIYRQGKTDGPDSPPAFFISLQSNRFI